MAIVNQRNLAVTANTKFLGTNVSPRTPDGWVTITVVPTIAGQLTVVHDDGTNEDDGILNDATDLNAGGEYSFSVVVPKDETVNFKFSATTTLKKLIIVEGA